MNLEGHTGGFAVPFVVNPKKPHRKVEGNLDCTTAVTGCSIGMPLAIFGELDAYILVFVDTTKLQGSQTGR